MFLSSFSETLSGMSSGSLVVFGVSGVGVCGVGSLPGSCSSDGVGSGESTATGVFGAVVGLVTSTTAGVGVGKSHSAISLGGT